MDIRKKCDDFKRHFLNNFQSHLRAGFGQTTQRCSFRNSGNERFLKRLLGLSWLHMSASVMENLIRRGIMDFKRRLF